MIVKAGCNRGGNLSRLNDFEWFLRQQVDRKEPLQLFNQPGLLKKYSTLILINFNNINLFVTTYFNYVYIQFYGKISLKYIY